MIRQIRSLLFDPTYSQAIFTRTLPQSLLIWFKFTWFVYAFYCLVGIAVFIYYAPQLPNQIKKNIPEASFSLSNGVLTITPDSPIMVGDSIKISSEGFYVKSPSGKEELQPYPKDVSLSFTTNQIVSYLNSHQSQVVFYGVLFVIFLIFMFSASYSIYQLLIIGGLALVLFTYHKMFRQVENFGHTLKLLIHASVPAFYLLAITFFPGSFASFLLWLFVVCYYYFSWYNILKLQLLSK